MSTTVHSKQLVQTLVYITIDVRVVYGVKLMVRVHLCRFFSRVKIQGTVITVFCFLPTIPVPDNCHVYLTTYPCHFLYIISDFMTVNCCVTMNLSECTSALVSTPKPNISPSECTSALVSALKPYSECTSALVSAPKP